MPDIKTALEKALAQTANAWAADDEAHQQSPQQEKPMTTLAPITTPKAKTYERNNVSRTTFEYIRKNPGLTVNQIIAALVEQGFKETSVSSLCYQMMRVRLVVADSNGKMTAVVQEYVPIQSNKRRRKAKPKANAKPVADVAPAPIRIQRDLTGLPSLRKHVEITNIRTGEVINPKPAPAPAEKDWQPSDVIDQLSVRQALALFKELRNILVG